MDEKHSKKGGFFSSLERFIGYFVPGAFLIAVTAGVFTEIILRKIFKTSLLGLEEFVALAMISFTFLSMSVIQKGNYHVKMDLVIDKLSSKLRDGIQVAVLFLSLMIFVVVTYSSALYTVDLYLKGSITVLRKWVVWPFYAAIPLGSMLISIRLFLQLIGKLKDRITG